MSYYPSPPSIPARKTVTPPPSGQTSGYGPQSSQTSNYAQPGQTSSYGPTSQPSGYGVQPPHPANKPSGYGVQPQPQAPASSGASGGYGNGGYGNYQTPQTTQGYGVQPGQSYNQPVQPTQSYGAQPVQPSQGYGVTPPQPTSQLYGVQPPQGASPIQPNQGFGVQPPQATQSYAQPSNQGYGVQPVQPPQVTQTLGQGDWFSQSGFASAIGAAAMTAMTGNQTAMTQMVAGAFDAEKQKSLTWFQTQTAVFKEYFNVTHAYVRWKLLFVLLPMAQRSSLAVSRAVSRDFPQSSSDSDEQTGQGSGIGLRLFPGRKPDLYIPVMGFITFVLMHALSDWEDFHPDDLYNVASLGILLGFVEVLVLKGASYVLNVAHWSLIDIIAVCGYKYANLSLSVVLLILFSFGGRIVWLGLYVLAAAMAGLTVHRGLVAVGSYNAHNQSYGGTHSPNMERLLALAAGAAQFLWIWILMPSMKVVAAAPVESTNS